MTEVSSIKQSLGDRTEAIVNGTKSMTGHLLGGAGALESMATLLAIHHRKIPPTINLDNPEPDLGIDIATKVRDLPAGDLAAINNSFGFGGHNVAVAFTNAYATTDRKLRLYDCHRSTGRTAEEGEGPPRGGSAQSELPDSRPCSIRARWN